MFLGILCAAALLLTCFVYMELRAPLLQAESGMLLLSEDLGGDAFYMLDGWKQQEAGSYTLRIRCAFGQKLTLYMPDSVNVALSIDGESAEQHRLGSYSVYTLPETDNTEITLDYQVLGVSPVTQERCVLYLGSLTRVLQVMQQTANQRMLVMGVAFAALVYSLSLYINKRSEKYLLLFALYALSTLLRTVSNAYPAINQLPFLRFLDMEYFSFLPLSGRGLSVFYYAAHTCLLTNLRYFLIRAFVPVKLGNRGYIWYLNAFFVLVMLYTFGGSDMLVADWLCTACRITAYLMELYMLIAGRTRYDISFWGMAFFWVLMIAVWLLNQLCKLDVIHTAVLMTRYGLGGLREILYLMGFWIIINAKFAMKFSEADILSTELEQTNLHLASLVAEKTQELQRSYAALQKTQAQRDEFISGVAHNLKTPLFSMMGHIDMLEDALEIKTEGIRRQLDQIRRGAHYVQRTFNDLLLSLRLESGKVEFCEDVFSLGDMLREIRDTAAQKAENTGVVLFVSLPEDIPRYKGDSFYILQALMNIVDNAIEHCYPGAKVQMGLIADAAGQRITVTDNGHGIEAKDLPYIFERCYSKHEGGRKSSGMGLAIASDIIGTHGGRIEVESKAGAGSCFTVYLPNKE